MRKTGDFKINEKLIGYFLVVGLLATITMDLTALVTVKSGLVRLGPYRLFPNMFGRWVGSFSAGKVFHSTILETPPIPRLYLRADTDECANRHCCEPSVYISDVWKRPTHGLFMSVLHFNRCLAHASSLSVVMG